MPGNFIQLDQGVPALDKNKKPEEQIEALRSYLKGFMEQLRYELRRMNGETRAIGTASKTASRNPEDYGYPIGSVYISTRAISPEHFFGGTWVQLQDRFLLAAGETYAAGTEGGEAEVTLTAAQSGLPAHSHAMNHGHGFTQPKLWRRQIAASGTDRWAFQGSEASHDGEATAHGGAVTNFSGSTGNNTAANASQAHNNMPPYMTVYMWERTE
ncbi:MAG: hypothetical protein IKI35_05775 [Stomatobaculum sp.]|nr:hypothetical protein [Stomatobaculum sp.]MBR7058218.1 hypothetical protein [Stomatobaculum sp.]